MSSTAARSAHEAPDPASGAADDAAIQQLVERAQGGDRDAFGEIYLAHQGQIRGFLMRRVRDVETAEDLAQQVFVKAWQALPRYQRTAAPFSAWLYRIARNALIDHYRRTRPTEGLDGVDLPDSSDRDAELIVAEQLEEVERALGALRDDYQQVIRLRFLMERSTREVAEVMGRSEGAVRVLQLRAIRALRAALGVEGVAA